MFLAVYPGTIISIRPVESKAIYGRSIKRSDGHSSVGYAQLMDLRASDKIGARRSE